MAESFTKLADQWNKCFQSDAPLSLSPICVAITLAVAMSMFVAFVAMKRHFSETYKDASGKYLRTFKEDLRTEWANGMLVAGLAVLAAPTFSKLVGKMGSFASSKISSKKSRRSDMYDAGREYGSFLEAGSW